MTPTSILAGLSACLAIIAGLFAYLYNGEVHDYARFRTNVEAAQEQAEKDAAKLAAEQRRIASETADGWSAAVDWHRAHPRVVRVLQPGNCVPEGGAISTASGEPDARPVEQGSGAIEITAEQCEARINAAVMDAAQALHLIHWIKQQHEASK